jgi:atypical dual specificity phosphatase
VNSGGVVFFALFGSPNNDDTTTKEAAAVIKFSSSSRMATQSERLGYEFAKHLGIDTPQVLLLKSHYDLLSSQ